MDGLVMAGSVTGYSRSWAASGICLSRARRATPAASEAPAESPATPSGRAGSSDQSQCRTSSVSSRGAGEGVPGGKRLVDRDHARPGPVGYPAAERIVRLDVADDPAAAVQVDQGAAVCLEGLVDPDRYPARGVLVGRRRHRLGHVLRAAAAQRQRPVVGAGLRRVAPDQRGQSLALEGVQDGAELRVERHTRILSGSVTVPPLLLARLTARPGWFTRGGVGGCGCGWSCRRGFGPGWCRRGGR